MRQDVFTAINFRATLIRSSSTSSNNPKMHLAMTLLFGFLISLAVSSAKANDDPVKLRAVRGQEARLPCGQGKLFLDGPNAYVLWLKNDRDFVYRFPNEHVYRRAGKRDYIFGTPCEAGLCQDDTSLRIKKASDHDAGLYRCRIHYQASPSVDFVIELKLVEPTGFPKIFSEDGEYLNKGFVGPLSLKSDLILICEVQAKDLETEVYWRRNGALVDRALVDRALVDSAFNSRRKCVIRVDIHLYNLSRGELDAKFECVAKNSDVSEPLVASVILKMYTPPLSIEIRINNNSDFEAGQPRVVDCVVVGCMPPPAVSWHLGSTMIRPSVHKELQDGNYTVSSLTLAPSLRDHRSELVCRAYNALMPGGRFEHKVAINVGYRPICGMSREPRVGAVEGETETVSCIVESYPEPLQFSWTFPDSNTIYTSSYKMAGFENRYNSRLTWMVRGGEIGILSCRATNKFGEMKKACTYNISAGGPPDLPDCEVTRIYPSSLRVQCEKGWDGGRPQMIHLDFVNEHGVRVKNVTDEAGMFFVPNCDDKHNMTAVLYATNSRGKSADRFIHINSLVPISEADSNYVQTSWMPYLEAAAVAISLLIFLTTCTLGVKILLSQQQAAAMNPDIVPRTDGVFHREPDFIRDERVLGVPRPTCITVNTLTGCQNQYSSSPKPACRVVMDHGAPSSPDHSSHHSYYV